MPAGEEVVGEPVLVVGGDSEELLVFLCDECEAVGTVARDAVGTVSHATGW